MSAANYLDSEPSLGKVAAVLALTVWEYSYRTTTSSNGNSTNNTTSHMMKRGR